MRLFMCLSKYLYIVLILFLWGLFVTAQEGKATEKREAESKEILVEGIGSGATRQDALHDAMRKAIEKAVGVYVTSKTTLQNNKLTEKIVVATDAVVTNYEEIDSFEQKGIWVLKIQARVLPNEYLKYAPKFPVENVEPIELGNIISKLDAYKNAEEAFKSIFPEDYPANLFHFKKESVELAPNSDLNEEYVQIDLKYTCSFDQVEFDKTLSRLSAVLERYSVNKFKYEQLISKNIYASIPEDLAEVLLKKAGLTNKDGLYDYQFVAFQMFKDEKFEYTLFLVPRRIGLLLEKYSKPSGATMLTHNNHSDDYIYYNDLLITLFLYKGSNEKIRRFCDLSDLSAVYYETEKNDITFNGIRLIGGTRFYFKDIESFIYPLLFSNKIEWPSNYFSESGKNSFYGSLRFSLPADSISNLEKVIMYPLRAPHEHVNFSYNSKELIQQCNKFEMDLFNNY